MPRQKRHYSKSEIENLWRRWKAGEHLSDIARALERKPGTVHTALSARGGIAPPRRKRRPAFLRIEEREEISRGLAVGRSFRAIATELGRAPSTISREVERNGGRNRYRPNAAERKAWKRALRPKPCKLAENGPLRRLVANRLKRDWSPEQIDGSLRRDASENADMRISHEAIYRSIYVQARGVLKKELMAHLRVRKAMRKSRSRSKLPRTRTTSSIQNEKSIRDRPQEVETRLIPGHWEGDLISGSKNTHIATLVERTTRYTMLVRLDGKDAITVRKALSRHLRKIPKELRRSLTWDRGSELAQHRELARDTDLEVYFCDPQSPWQRGTNENTNGLIRQYMPKKTDLRKYSQAELSRIANRLNSRPRKALDFDTPINVFNNLLR